MAFVPNNIYVIYSVAAPNLVLDLVDGSPDNGTSIHNFTDHTPDLRGFNQQWLVSEVTAAGQRDCYTFRNLRGGTYLDLSDGKKSNGTKVQGWRKAQPDKAKNQQWKIVPVAGQVDKYRIQNVAGGTYLDIKDRNLEPSATIHAWEIKDTPTQQWTFKRISRAGHEITGLLRQNPYIQQVVFKSFCADGLYITLPQSIRDDIYNSTKLKTTEWREEIFDCDDFAFVAKAEVAKWGTNYLRGDDFAILFGIMFGTNDHGGAHAYNWYLSDVLDRIVFFEPQNGTQQEDIGYMAYFGVF